MPRTESAAPMRKRLSDALGNEKIRFLLAGASTTLASYALYLLLLATAMRADAAYAISYVAGYVWSYLVNSRWVFRAPMGWRSFLRYPLVYLAQAAAAFLLFKFLVDFAGIPAAWAPLVIVALTVPLTYVISRAVIRRKPPGTDE